MEVKIIESNGHQIAEHISDQVLINTSHDALDLMANARYQGASSIILYERNLNPKFFDLRTGLAGEILQKYSIYHAKVAIIGEFEKFNSKSLNAFIIECNRGKLAFFVPDVETAIAKLTR